MIEDKPLRFKHGFALAVMLSIVAFAKLSSCSDASFARRYCEARGFAEGRLDRAAGEITCATFAPQK